MQQLSIRSFLAQGHRYDLFAYGEPSGMPQGTVLQSAEAVLPKEEIYQLREAGRFSGSYASFSNVFRYKLLSERGGWWADLDVICLCPFDFQEEWVFASQRRRNGASITASCVIKAPAGSPMLEECFQQSLRHEKRDSLWGVTGPALLHEVVERSGLSRFIWPPETFCPLDWWRAQELLVPGHPPESAVGLHLWNEVWRQAGWSKDPSDFPGSLYEHLHALYSPPI